MKSNYIKIWGLAAALSLTSCLKDLDQDPSIDPDSKTENSVKANLEEAEQALAKVYASLALTGQQGPSGSPDIQGIDEGTSQFTRLLFYMQELPTDEAVVAWSDPGVPDFHNMNWTKSNGIIEAMYYRLAQTVSFANSFISVNQDSQFDEMKRYGVAEARFVRAYAYYYLMDLVGDTPIVTEIVPAGTFYPAQEEYLMNYYENNTDRGYCIFTIAPKINKIHDLFQKRIKPTYQALEHENRTQKTL